MLQYHCRLYIFTHTPACLYSEPLKAIILCIYLVMKGQTVTGRPVFWWKSSMLLVRYCCTLSSCFSDGKTFCFSRPAPESPSITMSTIDRVVLSSPLIKIRVWSSAERTSSPCPSCVGLWQVVEPPSSPVASAPIDSSSPEKLCVSEVV